MSVSYSVVVPGLNEAENLKVLLPHLKEAFQKTGKPYEVIFVDNGSTDDSGEVVKSFQASMPELRFISEPMRGYGRAVRKGLRETRGPLIGIIRSDNQEKPEDLVMMFGLLEESGLPLYKAIRLHRMNEGLQRVVVSFVFNLLFKIMFGLKSIDINASPKLFTRAFYEEAKLESDDFFIDAEMVIKAETLGYRVGEVGIEYYPRLAGKSNVRLKHIVEFLRNMGRWASRMHRGSIFAPNA